MRGSVEMTDSVDCNEHIEMFSFQRQKLSIVERSPAHLTGGLGIMTENVSRQTPVYAFVENHLHQVDSTGRSLASSRKAMTWARVTDGKPSRKASIDSPASK